jgi:transposase
MKSKPSIFIPHVFRSFKGFRVVDIKDFTKTETTEIHLIKKADRIHHCARCHHPLGAMHSRYRLRVKHLRMMGWTVVVVFFREKRWCANCQKIRSERIDFICEDSPHMTLELGWWVNRLTEITSVLAVSRLEKIDKNTCYRLDKLVLRKLLQGYRIPKITKISVDEVYARSRKQLKNGEDRDDLFLTVITDIKTHKVIWVSDGRKKESLDRFFKIIGSEACENIRLVATDQHPGYQASIKEFCPKATLVWDRFHLVQRFNEALNDERKDEFRDCEPGSELAQLISHRYRYVYLTRASKRSKWQQRHIDEVLRINERIAKLELIKEHFLKLFDCTSYEDAREMMAQVYIWAIEVRARHIIKFLRAIKDHPTFWNYFKYKVSTGLSEGINRVIKGLKWQAYGYKDMFYFALKILQKSGYLNSRYHEHKYA